VLPGVVCLPVGSTLQPAFRERYRRTEERLFLSLLFTTILAGLMTAPTTFHRLRWRHGDKQKMLEIMNRLTIAGGVFLALQ
jgi:hypothetical protein